ncbi:MAG: SCO family protein [Bryobacterales bacterium]|nr:SCO family protein [Bryobacterales bacterium]
MTFLRMAACLAAGLATLWGQSLDGSFNQPPNEDLYLYHSVPDILIQPAGKPAMPLSELWRDRPLLITMVFTRCAGVCYPFLRSLRSAAESAVKPPSGYRILVLSFDSRDTAADMKAAAAGIGAAGEDRWIFATAAEESIGRLSKATGFWFRWDGNRRQFDHPAVLLAVNHGRLVRLFAGGRISTESLGSVLRDLDGGFVPSYPLADKTSFRCFQYNAATGRYSLDWGAMLLVLPGTLAFLAALLTFRPWRRRCARAPFQAT